MPTPLSQPTIIEAAGNKPKRIEEFVGLVNSGTTGVSVARMTSPAGWVEPGQTPEFDEYTLVLRGTLRVETRGGALDVPAGQAVQPNKVFIAPTHKNLTNFINSCFIDIAY